MCQTLFEEMLPPHLTVDRLQLSSIPSFLVLLGFPHHVNFTLGAEMQTVVWATVLGSHEDPGHKASLSVFLVVTRMGKCWEGGAVKLEHHGATAVASSGSAEKSHEHKLRLHWRKAPTWDLPVTAAPASLS